jgi:AraC family transcriptional regulator, regulatory protein of adaptative response / methylated-DNA-[protein]-cysteine methyltransferase
MDSLESTNYERIAKAIQFLVDNHKQQPSLEMLAEHLDLSIFHLQRLFSEWAGISPKQFQKYINIQQAKKLLKQQQLSLFDTTHEIGLSSTSRLHDLFISIEAMSPAEYKDGAAGLSLKYNFYLLSSDKNI